MRHAAAGDDDGAQPRRLDPARQRLAEAIAAQHRRLRWHVGIDVERHDRRLDAKKAQRDAEGVVDPGVVREGRVEPFLLHVQHELHRRVAGNTESEIAADERARRLLAEMEAKGRRAVEQKLVGVVVGDHDPEIGLERRKPRADLAHREAHALDRRLVLGVGEREELRRVRHQRAAQNTLHTLPPSLRPASRANCR